MKDIKQQILDATNQGLDIILVVCPQASVAVENKSKAFKYRSDEKTPSAYLYPPSEKCDWWGIKDYGLSDKKMSPFDLYMRENGIDQSRFSEVLYTLAEKYGVHNELTKSANKPEWIERSAKDGEKEGEHVFETRDSFTANEVSLWGPNVKEKHLRDFGWLPVVYVGTIKNGKVKECHSTETYPIFIQRCPYISKDGIECVFYKVYKPKEYNKKFRFFYINRPPEDYIYGLDLARKAYNLNNQKKLDKLFICSGGSDAVNLYATVGYNSVYLYSETADMTEKQYKQLTDLSERIYNIPDIDATGIKMGHRMALKFLDVYTVWLPIDFLGRYHDNRMRSRKDLKDFITLRPNPKELNSLIYQARQAKFWYEDVDNDGEVSYRISPVNLNYFLEQNGFYTLHDDSSDKPCYVRLEGIIVTRVTPMDISNFLISWAKENAPLGVQNKIMRSHDLPNKDRSFLTELSLDFTTYTNHSQRCYFKNCWVEVTATEITRHEYSEAIVGGHYIWSTDIIPHNYRPHEPMFNITRRDDGRYSVNLTEHANSDVLKFTVNISRIFWREEDEYHQTLSEEQLAQQEQCLASHIAANGYYGWRYKSDAHPYACFCQDYHIGEKEGECNGRSGKSFDAKWKRNFMNSFPVDGSNPKITEKQFLFDGVTEGTGLITVDECAKDLKMNFFFGKLSDGILIEEKHNHQFFIPYDKSPKFLFCSNHVLKDIDASTQARLWPQVYSDYYHEKTKTNGFRESRSIEDDFGYLLQKGDYPEKKCESDIAFELQCIQFYMSLPDNEKKILPPLENIEKRQALAKMGADFDDWAKNALGEGSEFLDREVEFDVLFNNYKEETKLILTRPANFTSKLKTYCESNAHIACYNPKDITGLKADGERWRKRKDGKLTPYIYIRSVENTVVPPTPSVPVETTLDFTDNNIPLWQQPGYDDPDSDMPL